MIGNKYKMNRGFSLVEFLIVLAMIGILSLVIIPSYQDAKQQLALQRSASNLAQDIRRVQEMATSAQEYSDCVSGFEYEYAIYLKESEPTSYKLFANCDNNDTYDSGNDIDIETIELEKGITISALSSGTLVIIFESPDPTIVINPSAVTIATITLINNNGQSKDIKVNKVGLVDID